MDLPATQKLVRRELQRTLVAAGLSVLALGLIWPFLPALTGACLLAIVTQRPRACLLRRVRNHTFCALLAVVAVTFCLVVPAGLAANLLVANAIDAIAFFRSPVFLSSLQQRVATINALTGTYGFHPIVGNLNYSMQRLVTLAASLLLSMFSGSIGALTQLISMLFLLFFWFRDGSRLQRGAMSYLPFSHREMALLLQRLRTVVKGTVFGRFIVAAVQGLLAWIALMSLDVPAASLLGSLTAVCSIFPAVGAYLVWLPVVVYLLLIHAWARAIILLLLGTAVLSTIDNVLFPIIAGSQTRMGAAQMFLSLFGGIWLFGVSGLVLGPVLWTLTEAVAAILRDRESISPPQNPS